MKVEYDVVPPQVFVAQMNRFIPEHQPPNRRVQLRWVKLPEEQQPPSETPSAAETYPYGSGRIYTNLHDDIILQDLFF